MILDKTFQLVTQCCFGALGLALLLAFRFDQATFRLALAGIGLLSLLAFGFWRMQRRGLMTLGHRWIQKVLRSQSRQEGAKLAQAMDARVSKLYLNRIKLLKGFMEDVLSLCHGWGSLPHHELDGSPGDLCRGRDF